MSQELPYAVLALPNTAELTSAKCLTGHESNLEPVDLFVSSALSPKLQGLRIVRIPHETPYYVYLHNESTFN